MTKAPRNPNVICIYADRYTKEERAAYGRAYRAKMKATKRLKEAAHANRQCRKCQSPVQLGSYFYCHNHNIHRKQRHLE